MVERRVFLDTAFAIALASKSDAYHPHALALAAELEQAGTRLVTTRAILLEIGNALAKAPYRDAAAELLQALEQDPTVEIVPLSDQWYARSFDLYCRRHDKEWGMTDCLSFVVMQELGLTGALTADEHFEQAGFGVLLRKRR